MYFGNVYYGDDGGPVQENSEDSASTEDSVSSIQEIYCRATPVPKLVLPKEQGIDAKQDADAILPDTQEVDGQGTGVETEAQDPELRQKAVALAEDHKVEADHEEGGGEVWDGSGRGIPIMLAEDPPEVLATTASESVLGINAETPELPDPVATENVDQPPD
jgi:hypothetical protein